MADLKMHPDESILKEADKLVYGDRNAAYGHPYTDYETTAELWSSLIKHKLKEPITPYEAGLMMIAMKLSRASRKYKRDNLTDIAGYAAVVEEIQQAINKGANASTAEFTFHHTPQARFEVGDYVRLTNDAYVCASPEVKALGNMNYKVSKVNVETRAAKYPRYFYEVVPVCTYGREINYMQFWEEWLQLVIKGSGKFKPGQPVTCVLEGRKQFIWVKKVCPVTPHATEHFYECTSCPQGGYVYSLPESRLEGAE